MRNTPNPAIHILDIDGSIAPQTLAADARLAPRSLHDWGPALRLACSFRRFGKFEQQLAQWHRAEDLPAITLIGSGDFHHLTLALLARLTTPFNLLVLDKHPDWMRGLPFLHCGTWLYHAARLPNVQRIFHLGGDIDFDNGFRWLAPWSLLRSGKIVVMPAVRTYQRGQWAGVPNPPLRQDGSFSRTRCLGLLQQYRFELARFPLYISVDKDVLTSEDAIVNWDSGHLHLDELTTVLETFLHAARGRIAGFDTVGDWSPVICKGLFRKSFHWTEHPSLSIDPAEATRRNEAVNRRLLDVLEASKRSSVGWRSAAA